MRELALVRNASGRGLDRLPRVVNSLGEDRFASELMDFLSASCGAHHYSLFRMTDKCPTRVVCMSRDGSDSAHRQFSLYVSGAYWRRDSFMIDTMRSIDTTGLSMRMIDTATMHDRDFRTRIYGVLHVRERILLCGLIKDQAFGLSILRSEREEPASSEELANLAALTPTLASILDKHITMVVDHVDHAEALLSLDEIEATLHGSSVRLPRREAEVCARILHGMTTAGIAIELGIGEETVVSYRKRAYQRLAIATQRELLVWYLREWSRCRTTLHRLGSHFDCAAGSRVAA